MIYSLVNGPIQEDKVVRHLCHNKGCCNPMHLLEGTHQENILDTTRNNPDFTPKRGEQSGLNVLMKEDVREIRNRLSTTEEKFKDIAKDYGVTMSQISMINRGIAWVHIDEGKYDYPIRDYFEGMLTSPEVLIICEHLKENKLTLEKIAELCGTNKNKVTMINNGKAWRKITSLFYDYPIKRGSKAKKLTDEQVLEIYDLLKKKDISKAAIARQFNTSKSNINWIEKGKTFSHIYHHYLQ